MSVAVGLWSLAVAPGEDPQVISPPADLKITNVALGENLQDENGRTTLKLSHIDISSDDEDDDDDENNSDTGGSLRTTVITSLTPGKIEQSTVDITLLEDTEYLFEVIGKNTLYLTGNYLTHSGMDGDDADLPDLDSEESFDLRDVSSDVEINPDELESDASRFEDVDDEKQEQAAKSAKRPRDSDAMDTDAAKPSKAEKKKNKKLKAENGEAVAMGAEQKGETEKNGDAEKGEAKDKKSKKDKKAKGDKVDGEGQTSETKELPGGLKIRDAKVGTGPTAKPQNRLKMRYIGKFQDGKIFDQNTKGAPFSFKLGAGEVIKGWDQGLVGMQVGGERVLVVPPHLAYGKKGSKGIPPNSTLTFECKLLEIK